MNPAWSMYALEKTPINDFYNEITSLVSGSEFTNPTVYHQLICEAHLLLRCELISGSSEEKEIKLMLKESAAKMADFLAR